MKSHKKAFGFSWISLSESSLFKGLRRPPRPGNSLLPSLAAWAPASAAASPPEGAASPLQLFRRRRLVEPRENPSPPQHPRVRRKPLRERGRPFGHHACLAWRRLAASSDRKKHHSVDEEKRKEKSRIFTPAVLGLDAPAAPGGDRSGMAWRRLCARGF
jgi:hypothetical protein